VIISLRTEFSWEDILTWHRPAGQGTALCDGRCEGAC